MSADDAKSSGAVYIPPTIESKVFPELYEKLPELKNHVVAITGTTSGTGYYAALAAANRGAHVVLLNRESERSKTSAEKLQSESKDGKFTVVTCDLQDFASVRAAAEILNKQFGETGIDVLINNAGVMALPDMRTKDGYDVQMQTNHLSHFLLTKELMSLLEKAASAKGEARVVGHSSSAAFSGTDVMEEKYFSKCDENSLGGHTDGAEIGRGPQWVRYHVSKQANVVFMKALHDRLVKSGSKIKSLAAHPGGAVTGLTATCISSGGWNAEAATKVMAICQSAEDGSCGIVSCAFLPNAKSGEYWGPVGFVGPAIILPIDEKYKSFIAEGNREILWKESVKACGDMF